MVRTGRMPNHPKGPGEKANEALLWAAAFIATGIWLGWYYDWPLVGCSLDFGGACLYPSYLSELPNGLPSVFRDSRVFMAIVSLAFGLCVYLLGSLFWLERLCRCYEDQDEQRRRRTAVRLQVTRDRADRRNRQSNRAQ
jgi:hypothetical protein